MKTYDDIFLHKTDKLKQMILDNPDLPLVVVKSGDDWFSDGYQQVFAPGVTSHIGEFLNCTQPANDERCYTDRDDFEEDLANFLADEYWDLSDEQFDEVVKAELAKFEPYWTKCIIIYC